MMAEIWKPQPKEVLLIWIEAIVTEASDELNDWESGFIDGIKYQLDYKDHLSEVQEGHLERIYTEKTK